MDFRLSCCALVALVSTGAAAAAEPFQVTSTTFMEGTMLPRRTSNNIPGNARCVGDNVSPQLAWKNAPEGTKSFAIVVQNPEGRGGLGSIHWVAYGIDPSITQLAEGEASHDSPKYVGGKNTLKVGHYSGPCTPAGIPQHYLFTVIATDLDPKALPAGLTLPEFLAKLEGHNKGATGLAGRFEHPK